MLSGLGSTVDAMSFGAFSTIGSAFADSTSKVAPAAAVPQRDAFNSPQNSDGIILQDVAEVRPKPVYHSLPYASVVRDNNPHRVAHYQSEAPSSSPCQLHRNHPRLETTSARSETKITREDNRPSAHVDPYVAGVQREIQEIQTINDNEAVFETDLKQKLRVLKELEAKYDETLRRREHVRKLREEWDLIEQRIQYKKADIVGVVSPGSPERVGNGGSLCTTHLNDTSDFGSSIASSARSDKLCGSHSSWRKHQQAAPGAPLVEKVTAVHETATVQQSSWQQQKQPARTPTPPCAQFQRGMSVGPASSEVLSTPAPHRSSSSSRAVGRSSRDLSTDARQRTPLFGPPPGPPQRPRQLQPTMCMTTSGSGYVTAVHCKSALPPDTVQVQIPVHARRINSEPRNRYTLF